MATNILSNKNLATPGVFYSSEISNAVNADIQAVLSAGATGQVKYSIERKTANGDWRPARGASNEPLVFTTVGDVEEGLTLVGLNAYAVRVKVEIFGGTGTLNLEYEDIS